MKTCFTRYESKKLFHKTLVLANIRLFEIKRIAKLVNSKKFWGLGREERGKLKLNSVKAYTESVRISEFVKKELGEKSVEDKMIFSNFPTWLWFPWLYPHNNEHRILINFKNYSSNFNTSTFKGRNHIIYIIIIITNSSVEYS